MLRIALILILALPALAGEDLLAAGYRFETQGQAQAAIEDGGLVARLDRVDAAVRLLPSAEGAVWDLSGSELLVVELENRAAHQSRINVRLRADGEWVGGAAVNPGERRALRFRLPHRWEQPPAKGVPQPRQVDTQRVASVDIFMQWPFERSATGVIDCRVVGLRTEGTADPASRRMPQPYLPLVDAYGQNVHGDWPEKVRSDEDLRAALAAERPQLEAARRPSGWNAYGGWEAGPQLEATSSFRTAKVDGRWWLVDPSGRLFFSHGIDVLRPHADAMRTSGRLELFAAAPDTNSWQPVDRNLQVKYGTADYLPAFHADLERRLVAWGMNSIGAWASEAFIASARTPYTLQLTEIPARMPRLGGMKLYDVFDPAYAAWMGGLLAEQIARREVVRRSIDDPMCIGYFIDNELGWGRDGQLAAVILACPPEQAAKAELVRFLQDRYTGIAQLNSSWGADYASWDALLAAREVPAQVQHRVDTDAFAERFAERYFSICRDAVKRGAPHRLYLGSRFIGTDSVKPWLYRACAKSSDVLSVNIYAHGVAGFPVADYPDVPVLIGEFHFGVRQRGMMSQGLCLAGADEGDRGLAYTRFMEGALAHPLIVGAHWFQFRDQPLLGRGDGEAYQIGFVDNTDRPYPALTAAARAIAERMYGLRAGRKE
ncbi:MAG: beta-galactosidase [Planctomycetes bacterium]|nr:beta-galactosidase [Planctomycetota bacterium]